jgi:predicted RNA-binding protein YlqC (UPF0109 family)
MMKKDKDKKDPLRPKEDVRITDKEKGFLNTLENIVDKNDKVYINEETFDKIKSALANPNESEVKANLNTIIGKGGKVLVYRGTKENIIEVVTEPF